MFIGHYSASFAAKTADPALKLWVLIGASQLLDILWSLFVIAGVERVEASPGVTEGLAFLHYPWTHSLAAALAWSAVAGLGARTLLNAGSRGSVLVGLVVLSHWFFDLLVHRADMPLWPRSDALFGLGLWNFPLLELAIELVLFAAAGALLVPIWRRRNLPVWRILAFLGFGILFMVAMRSAPPPQEVDPTVVGTMGLFAYLLFVLLAWAAERAPRNRIATS
jgi:membrane-bound metal-dependent hydrolase YbcI (DUF457 family)